MNAKETEAKRSGAIRLLRKPLRRRIGRLCVELSDEGVSIKGTGRQGWQSVTWARLAAILNETPVIQASEQRQGERILEGMGGNPERRPDREIAKEIPPGTLGSVSFTGLSGRENIESLKSISEDFPFVQFGFVVSDGTEVSQEFLAAVVLAKIPLFMTLRGDLSKAVSTVGGNSVVQLFGDLIPSLVGVRVELDDSWSVRVDTLKEFGKQVGMAKLIVRAGEAGFSDGELSFLYDEYAPPLPNRQTWYGGDAMTRAESITAISGIHEGAKADCHSEFTPFGLDFESAVRHREGGVKVSECRAIANHVARFTRYGISEGQGNAKGEE